MSVLRAFIAIDLPPEIQGKLDQAARQLRAGLPEAVVRWVPAKNIHLTLKFLGDVSINNLEYLKHMLDSEAARCPIFEIEVGELGAFPNLRRPRVILVKVTAPAELGALQRGIEDGAARLGYAREERPFSPHLTLGRVSRNAAPQEAARIGQALEGARVGSLGKAQVRAVHLYRSDLQPSGAIYTILHSGAMKT